MAGTTPWSSPIPHRNGDGHWPWWVRLISVVGPSGALVFYLVYMGAQEVPQTRRLAEQILQETLRNREMHRELEVQIEELKRLLIRICANTARTNEDRNSCFDQ